MKGKLLRILSAVVTVPIIATSMIFANDVTAATTKAYSDGQIPHYDLTPNVTNPRYKNQGYYLEPADEGKYPVMIFFHGASGETEKCCIGQMPERMRNYMNRWVEMGYCDKMVIVTPEIYQDSAWGITEFEEFVNDKEKRLTKLIEAVKAGKISDKVDPNAPIILAGYSQGGSEALYGAIKNKDVVSNVGAFSSSYCCYNGLSNAWIKDISDFTFSNDPNGHYFISVGAGEGNPYVPNYDVYTGTQVVKNQFKKLKINADFGQHGWMVFEEEIFDYLYYLKFNTLPSEETAINACWANMTITGSTTVGSTLTTSVKGYYGTSFTYQWYREDSSGKFNAISGATSKTYTLTSADAGHRVRCKIKSTIYDNGFSYKTTDVISSSQQPQTAIKGSVSISGSEIRYGYEVSAVVSDCNATNLKYQWKRGNAVISGATSSKYTFQKDDIGTNITCVVSDKDGKLTGTISSRSTTVVQKGKSPEAPSVTAVDCSSKGAKDGKITNVSTAMEYASGNQNGTYTACTGTSITGLGAGTYYVRLKETSTAYAGKTATVTIGEKSSSSAISGTVSLSSDTIRYGISVQATVSNGNTTNLKYQWMRNGSAINGATSDWYQISKEDVGNQISCVISDKSGKYTGTISSSKFTVLKACGPVAPSVTGVNCSSKGAKDGKISNVSTAMEYAVVTSSGPSAYTACTGTSITGLSAGTYYVRAKETSYVESGAIATVIISENAAPSISGTVTLSSDTIRYGISVQAKVSNSNAANLKYQWMRGTTAISGATSEWYQITKEDIGNQLSCVVTDKDGKLVGSISSQKTTVLKACGPAAPNVTGSNCSSKGAKDGKIQNVSDKMEYTVLTQGVPGEYVSCSGTSITGLSAGTYYVRYKETASVDAGAITEIHIGE